jgi:hypothetical protein
VTKIIDALLPWAALVITVTVMIGTVWMTRH